jgi:hypothetical protein
MMVEMKVGQEPATSCIPSLGLFGASDPLQFQGLAQASSPKLMHAAANQEPSLFGSLRASKFPTHQAEVPSCRHRRSTRDRDSSTPPSPTP